MLWTTVMNEYEQNNKQRGYFLKKIIWIPNVSLFKWNIRIARRSSDESALIMNAGLMRGMVKKKTVKNKKKLQDLKAHFHTYTTKQILTIWIVPTHKWLNLVEAGWSD